MYEVVMRDCSHDDAMAEHFREEPEYLVDLLNSILEDGEEGELMIVLRQMVKAFGGSTVAGRTGLDPAQLYRALLDKGNLKLHSLAEILNAMGFRLIVERVPAA